MAKEIAGVDVLFCFSMDHTSCLVAELRQSRSIKYLTYPSSVEKRSRHGGHL